MVLIAIAFSIEIVYIITIATRKQQRHYGETWRKRLIMERKTERQYWWDNLPKEIKTILNIPNFDAEIFKEITGIDVK